jgi:hypothetical protein
MQQDSIARVKRIIQNQILKNYDKLERQPTADFSNPEGVKIKRNSVKLSALDPSAQWNTE